MQVELSPRKCQDFCTTATHVNALILHLTVNKRCDNTHRHQGYGEGRNWPLRSLTMPPISTQPSAKTWILKFKHHTTTVLLHIDPLQSFSSVKGELLAALEQTHKDGLLDGKPIPRDSNEILLGRPRDHNDLALGYELIHEAQDDDSDAGAVAGKGKGKAAAATAKAGKSAKAQLKDCPQGAGLRDHGVVAFKFRRPEDVVVDSVEPQDDEGIVVSKEDMQGVEEEWDVVVPTFEETYGDEP